MKKNILTLAAAILVLFSCSKNASGGNKGVVPVEDNITTEASTIVEPEKETTTEVKTKEISVQKETIDETNNQAIDSTNKSE